MSRDFEALCSVHCTNTGFTVSVLGETSETDWRVHRCASRCIVNDWLQLPPPSHLRTLKIFLLPTFSPILRKRCDAQELSMSFKPSLYTSYT